MKIQSKIAFICKKMNAEDYKKLLVEQFAGISHSMDGSKWIFQQDNTSCHKAKVVMHWLSKQKIDILSWPPYSPDLNSIENLWGLLARKIYNAGVQYSTKNDLKSAISNAWNQVTEQDQKNLVSSIPSRILN